MSRKLRGDTYPTCYTSIGKVKNDWNFTERTLGLLSIEKDVVKRQKKPSSPLMIGNLSPVEM